MVAPARPPIQESSGTIVVLPSISIDIDTRGERAGEQARCRSPFFMSWPSSTFVLFTPGGPGKSCAMAGHGLQSNRHLPAESSKQAWHMFKHPLARGPEGPETSQERYLSVTTFLLIWQRL